jgi:hypothetical protein
MKLIHIKMKNGEDLLGYLVSSTDHHIEINTPIAVDIEPALGFFAKSWLMLSENNSVRLSKEDYMFWSNANKKATNKGGFSLTKQKLELKSHHLLVLLTQTFNAQ